MKLLFDQNISYRLVNRILDIFPEAKQIGELDLIDASDRKIWEFAKENDYVIVTFDSDFYDFSVVWGHPPKVIWLRTGNTTTAQTETVIRAHQSTIQHFVLDESLACLEILRPQ